MASTGDREWLWLSLGAAACVVGGVLFGSAIERVRDRPHTRSIRLEDIKMDPCDDEDEDGATIIRRLRETDWNVETIEFFDRLDIEHVSDAQLRALAREQSAALEKEILSMKIICKRFRSAKELVRLFTKLLEVHTAALSCLSTFARDVLRLDLSKLEVSAEAQSYSHCFSFMASHSSSAEITGAIAVIFPLRWSACGRLGNALLKSKRWSRKQIAFANTLARPLPDFDELTGNALNEGLQREMVSWRKIESSVKVLQASEKLFWGSIMKKRKKPDPKFEISTALPCATDNFWEDVHVNVPALPTIRGVLSDNRISFDLPKKETKKPRLSLQTPIPNRRSRLNLSNVSIPSGLYLDRVANMSPAEVDTEIEHMTRHMHHLSSNFNALQDGGEEQSQSDESSYHQSGLVGSQDFDLSRETAQQTVVTKEECNKPDNWEKKDSVTLSMSEVAQLETLEFDYNSISKQNNSEIIVP